jgi:hypothetical protein
METRVEAWLRAACADADQRGLPELKPLLEALARSTAALRVAEEHQRLRARPEPPRDARDA